MAYDEKLAPRVRGALAGAGAVEEKKMFRGLTFMVNGKMCISVGPTEMMCRIDPARHRAFLKRKGCCTVLMRGHEYIGWIRVSPEGMQRKQDFDFWIGQALDFNQRAKASKRKRIA